MVTYFVVQSFERGHKGMLISDAPQEARSAEQALAVALRLAAAKAGVVAFSRTGDPESGEFADAVILAQHGTVPGEVLEAVA